MKKAALIIAVIFTLGVVFFVPKTSFAQTLTFERSFQDYQYSRTVYDQAYSDYQNAKNAYTANPTLALKEAARQKLLAMLISRDELMAVYLTALRTKISELPGLSSEDKNNIYGKIDPDVNFYVNHKSNYSKDDTLETLFNKNAESQSQYKNTTSLISKESLFDISLGEVAGLRISHEEIYKTLKAIIDAGVASGTLTRDPFNRWLTDIDATDQRLRENEATSKTQIAKIYSQAYSFQGGYDSAIETLESSINPLFQLNEFLTEVLNYIKTHQ